MTVRLDYTAFSVVWVCALCGRRGLGIDRAEAWRSADHHQRQAHPGEHNARDMLRHL